MCTTCKTKNCNCSNSNSREIGTVASLRSAIAKLNVKINEALQEINYSTFQDVTERGNVTNNYIAFKKVLSGLSEEDLKVIYKSLTFIQEDEVSKILFNTYLDELNPTAIELSKSGFKFNIEDLLSLEVTKDGSSFKTTVSGLDGVKPSDYITLQQQNLALETKVEKVEGKSLVENTEIIKLEGLKTQSTIDAEILSVKTYTNDVVKQTVSETIPITGTVLPRGSQIPSWVTTNGKATLYGKTGGTTYTNTGTTPTSFLVPEGYILPVYYNKLTDIWTGNIADIAPLPKSETKIPVYNPLTTYTSGQQFIKDQIAYEVKTGQTLNAGEVPETSTKLTKELGVVTSLSKYGRHDVAYSLINTHLNYYVRDRAIEKSGILDKITFAQPINRNFSIFGIVCEKIVQEGQLDKMKVVSVFSAIIPNGQQSLDLKSLNIPILEGQRLGIKALTSQVPTPTSYLYKAEIKGDYFTFTFPDGSVVGSESNNKLANKLDYDFSFEVLVDTSVSKKLTEVDAEILNTRKYIDDKSIDLNFETVPIGGVSLPKNQTNAFDTGVKIQSIVNNLSISGAGLFKPDGSLRRLAIRTLGKSSNTLTFSIWAESDDGKLDGTFFFLKQSLPFSAVNEPFTSNTGNKTIYISYDINPNIAFNAGGNFSTTEIYTQDFITKYIFGGQVDATFNVSKFIENVVYFTYLENPAIISLTGEFKNESNVLYAVYCSSVDNSRISKKIITSSSGASSNDPLNIDSVVDSQVDYLKSISIKTNLIKLESQESIPTNGIYLSVFGDKLFLSINGIKKEIQLI